MIKLYERKPCRAHAGFTLVEIMIVVTIISVLFAIAAPNFVNAREFAGAKACVGNLKQIDSASQQYAMDAALPNTAAIDSIQNRLVAGGSAGNSYLRSMPKCPENGTYSPGANMSVSPTCSVSFGPGAWGGDFSQGQKYYHGF